MIIQPTATYVLLDENGTATPMVGGDAFWSQSAAQLDAIGQCWLMAEFAFAGNWPNWEMHPHADEVVYLLEGEVRMLLQFTSGIAVHPLQAPAAMVIPKGVWHSAETAVPCRMLHLTMGDGTLSQPTAPLLEQP